MCNYSTVPCHVTKNLVTKDDAYSDQSVWDNIMLMSQELQMAETKVCMHISEA